MLILFIIAIMIPIRLAFYEEDSLQWRIVNSLIDISFLVDIILTFFSSYFDERQHMVVTDHKVIAKKYLRGWFWLDFISILPMDYIFNAMDVNQFARILRIGKIYKLVRMTRLIRFLKLIKDRNRI